MEELVGEIHDEYDRDAELAAAADPESVDAGLTIERFSARLRDQVDLDTLSAELLAVVDHTMRPTATSLWLRPSAADSAPSAPLARSRPD